MTIVLYQIEISLDDLVFDLESSRFIERIRTQEAMLELLLETGVLQELMLSIGHQGYYPNRPLQTVSTEDGRYMVVDGNRRLAALKLLRDPDLCERNSVDQIAKNAIHTPFVIPCVVSSSRSFIVQSFAIDHTGGLIPWDMRAKACYFSEAKADDSVTGIAMSTGLRKAYINRLIDVYAIFQRVVDADFYGIEGLNEISFSFATFADILSYDNVFNYIAVEGDWGLESSVCWRFEVKDGVRRIGSSAYHADFNRIVGSRKAFKLFREGALISQALIVANMDLELT